MEKKTSKYTIVAELYHKEEFVGFELVQRLEQSFKCTYSDIVDTFNLADQTDAIITLGSDNSLELTWKFGKAKTKVDMTFTLGAKALDCNSSNVAKCLQKNYLENLWFEFRLYEDMTHTYIDRKFFNPNLMREDGK